MNTTQTVPLNLPTPAGFKTPQKFRFPTPYELGDTIEHRTDEERYSYLLAWTELSLDGTRAGVYLSCPFTGRTRTYSERPRKAAEGIVARHLRSKGYADLELES